MQCVFVFHLEFILSLKMNLNATELIIPPCYVPMLGATGVDKTPFMNLMAVAPGVVEFVKTTDCRGSVKDADYLATFVVSYVEDLGQAREEVVQVCTFVVAIASSCYCCVDVTSCYCVVAVCCGCFVCYCCVCLWLCVCGCVWLCPSHHVVVLWLCCVL